ncbi:MAG: hypothetical protein K9L59_06290 [Desulfobacterales bacterium]|nr:hypothetical protein [Desulfobacterales bacterium]
MFSPTRSTTQPANQSTETGEGMAENATPRTYLTTSKEIVVGGQMLFVAFGAIMVVGLNSLVKAGQDLTEPRNLSIAALILVFGIGGMSLSAGEFSLEGIGLAGIMGVVLNLVLPRGKAEDREKTDVGGPMSDV